MARSKVVLVRIQVIQFENNHLYSPLSRFFIFSLWFSIVGVICVIRYLCARIRVCIHGIGRNASACGLCRIYRTCFISPNLVISNLCCDRILELLRDSYRKPDIELDYLQGILHQVLAIHQLKSVDKLGSLHNP